MKHTEWTYLNHKFDKCLVMLIPYFLEIIRGLTPLKELLEKYKSKPSSSEWQEIIFIENYFQFVQ